MSVLLAVLLTVAIVSYVGFIVAVFVFDERYMNLTDTCYVINMLAFWIGFIPAIGLYALWEKVFGLRTDDDFLKAFLIAAPIGWGVIIGGIQLAVYLFTNFSATPVG